MAYFSPPEAGPSKTATELTLSTATLWTMKVPFYVVLTGDMGREKVLVTEVKDSKTLVLSRGAAIGQTALDHSVARPSSYPSVSDADLWVCPPNRYMDQEYCDCNCGMTDPDCLSGTLPTRHCNMGDSEICSPLGRCTQAVYSGTGVVAVSAPCHDIVMPGETLLKGYLGHAAEWQDAGSCGTLGVVHFGSNWGVLWP